MHTDTHKNTHPHARTYTYPGIHTHDMTCTHIHTHAHSQAYIHMTCTHIHTHADIGSGNIAGEKMEGMSQQMGDVRQRCVLDEQPLHRCGLTTAVRLHVLCMWWGCQTQFICQGWRKGPWSPAPSCGTSGVGMSFSSVVWSLISHPSSRKWPLIHTDGLKMKRRPVGKRVVGGGGKNS